MYLYSKKTWCYVFIVILCSSLLITGYIYNKTASSSEPLSKQSYVLGTIVNITLCDHPSEALIDEAFSELSKLENILSVNKTNTLIDQINESSGISPVQVDEETYQLIEKGLYYSDLTSGAFDITIGPIVKLWHIGFEDFRVPNQSEIDNALPLVDYHLVTLSEANHSIYLEKSGMQLDLGGIAKGYAADQVAQLLRQNGVQSAMIDLGGNLYALGDKPNHEPWIIGIQDPLDSRGESLGSIAVSNKSIVTSGIYERYNTGEDGKTYHHLLNPSTGYPFDNEIAGVSIISDSSTDGDALSTSAFALGVKEGIDFIESLDGVDAIFVTTDKKIYITSGIKEGFNLLRSDYSICN